MHPTKAFARPWLRALLLLLALGFAPPLLAQGPAVTRLARVIAEPVAYSEAYAINDRGDIGGEFQFTGSPTVDFLFNEDGLFSVRALNPGHSLDISALNASGVAAGIVFGGSTNSAFRFQDGTLQEITLSRSGFNGITDLNDSGVLVGEASLPLASDPRFTRSSAVMVTGNSITDLGSLSPSTPGSTARGINNAGVIVGQSDTLAPNGLTTSHAFRFADGVMSSLHGALGGNPNGFSTAVAINNLGAITGNVDRDGFYLEDGVVTRIAAPSSFFTPNKLNDRGFVIGGYAAPQTQFLNLPFLFQNGSVFDLNTLAQPFMAVGDGVGFTQLRQARDLNNRNQIVGFGLFRDGAGVVTTQAFRLDLALAAAFVWEGAEGFAFRTDGNWSEGVAPGALDTVQLTAPGQLKTIEFAAGDAVTNQRLLAGSGSETDVDLNGGLWRIDGGANPAPTGQFRLAGASLTVKDGTLEIFGRAEAANDAGGTNLLSLIEGGKLVVRADDFVAGVGGGTRDTLLEIGGGGSLLQARDVVLGAGGGAVTALVSGGGAIVADRELRIGAGGAASVSVTGAGTPTGSFVQVAEGGRLTIGGAAAGSLSVSNGASAILTDVDVTIGAQGSFSLAGEFSRVNGGRFTVREGGQLVLADAPTIVESVTAEGGAVFLQRGAIVNAGPVAVTAGGSFTVESGATAIATTLDVAAITAPAATTGSARVEGGSHLRVAGAARVGGSFGGNGLLEIAGRDGVRASRLTAETDLTLGGALGAGRLLVEDGATAAIAGDLVAFAPAPTGEDPLRSEIHVRGTDSALTAGNVFLLSRATLEVGKGAALTVTNALSVGSGSALTVFGDATLGDVSLVGDTPFVALIGAAARAAATSVTMASGIFAVDDDAVLVAPTFTLDGGLLSGRGRIVGDVVQNGGQILPGSSPGALTIDGDFTQTGGRIVLEIGGLAPGAQYDQLVIRGDFSLDGGTIEFAFVDGFAPRAGEAFAFFAVAGDISIDAALTVSGLEDGWEFETAFDPATGAFGLTSLTDGIAAVPEPGPLALLALAAGLLAARRSRRERPTRYGGLAETAAPCAATLGRALAPQIQNAP